jgi:hypothetical protein
MIALMISTVTNPLRKNCLISRVRASGSDLLAHRLGPKPVKKQRRQPPVAPTSLQHDCRQTIGPTDYGLETARETQDVLAFPSSFRQLDIQACDPVDDMVRSNMEVEWESLWGVVMWNEYQTLLHIIRLQTLREKTSTFSTYKHVAVNVAIVYREPQLVAHAHVTMSITLAATDHLAKTRCKLGCPQELTSEPNSVTQFSEKDKSR